MLLIGDIGGTKTHLAFFDDKSKKAKFEKKYPSQDYPGLEEICLEFFKEGSIKPQDVAKACFGVAGPVVDGRCKTTNLPWVIDSKSLETKLKIAKAGVINDLEANAYGIKMLDEKEFSVLQEGSGRVGNQALIAAGTGLGEACLVWNGKSHIPFSSEGGHTDFAPRDELEMELFRYLKKQFGQHVSYERVLSGSGLYQLYRFLIDLQLEKEDQEMRKKFSQEDPARVITIAALEGTNHLCVRVVRWFLSLYGAEAGNLALKFLSIGGIYIGGGIAPKLLALFKHGDFLEGFLEKGRFHPMLKEMTVKIILNDDAALLGALRYAEEFI
jgi:glucokinase